MPNKKPTLDVLVGKQVMIQGSLDTKYQGPCLINGFDKGFVCLTLEEKQVWCNLSEIMFIRETEIVSEAS